MYSTPNLKWADVIVRSRITGRYLLLLICALTLCFQQSVGLVFANAKYRLDSQGPQIRKYIDQAQGAISHAVSLHSFPPAEQLEFSEDDDPTHTQHQPHLTSRDLSGHEQALAQSIRTGYLQQSIAVMQMKRLPLFLMHHQWKYFLI